MGVREREESKGEERGIKEVGREGGGEWKARERGTGVKKAGTKR